MYLIEADESREHMLMVEELRYKFRREFTECLPKIEIRPRPDYCAYSPQKGWIIGEAERCEDLDKRETFETFRIYSNLYLDEAKAVLVPLYIKVPKKCVEKLRKKLSQDPELSKRKNIFIDP